MAYLAKFFNTYVEVSRERVSKEVDLDAMLDTLPNNAQAWVYREERQQSKTRCATCRTVYDVLGKYALCPACAKPNYEASFHAAFEVIRASLSVTGIDPQNLPGELFSKIFTEYEALANAVRRQLIRLPMAERRRKDVERINFQRLVEASKFLDQYFGIRVNEGLSGDDIVFLNVMVNRRHILIHEAGRVDERYLEQTQDSSVRLNEIIKVTRDDATKTIDIVSRCGMNLLRDWNSIK